MFQSLKVVTCLAVACLVASGADLTDATELSELRALVRAQQEQIRSQQSQIDQLRQTVNAESEVLEALAAKLTPASAAPALRAASFEPAQQNSPVAPVAAAAPQPAGNAMVTRVDQLSKTVETIDNTLRGFRFTGDFRYRLDAQLRSSNAFAGPQQQVRSRYRLRLNIDKEMAPGLTTHLQLSSGPYNNEITNDNDFGGLATKHPFGLSEAWVRYNKKGFSVRGGRVDEVFADNSRFLWDDDLRLNGFDARYERRLSRNTTLELRAGEYILTNPNTPVVPVGSPFLSIGYQVGQKVRSATLFHPGFVIRTRTEAWTHQVTGSLSVYRSPNQINLTSTAAGAAALTGSNMGFAPIGALGGAGNATVAPGSPILAAARYQVAHASYRVDYRNFKIGKYNMPLWADFQSAVNVGTKSDRVAYMATLNLGETRKRGDLRLLYIYSYKQANSMISQFTDDDLGNGTGVNTRVNHFRIDLGLTRSIQLQNLLFIQDPIAGNRPGFSVNIPTGANTTFRYQGQLAFSF